VEGAAMSLMYESRKSDSKFSWELRDCVSVKFARFNGEGESGAVVEVLELYWVPCI
jgi:hypothetical protein